jgi:hypothetical protein
VGDRGRRRALRLPGLVYRPAPTQRTKPRKNLMSPEELSSWLTSVSVRSARDPRKDQGPGRESIPDLGLHVGAGDGNRTCTTSLESSASRPPQSSDQGIVYSECFPLTLFTLANRPLIARAWRLRLGLLQRPGARQREASCSLRSAYARPAGWCDRRIARVSAPASGGWWPRGPASDSINNSSLLYRPIGFAPCSILSACLLHGEKIPAHNVRIGWSAPSTRSQSAESAHRTECKVVIEADDHFPGQGIPSPFGPHVGPDLPAPTDLHQRLN